MDWRVDKCLVFTMRSVLWINIISLTCLCTGVVIEESFATLKQSPSAKMVVFYDSLEEKSNRVVNLLNEASKVRVC